MRIPAFTTPQPPQVVSDESLNATAVSTNSYGDNKTAAATHAIDLSQPSISTTISINAALTVNPYPIRSGPIGQAYKHVPVFKAVDGFSIEQYLGNQKIALKAAVFLLLTRPRQGLGSTARASVATNIQSNPIKLKKLN